MRDIQGKGVFDSYVFHHLTPSSEGVEEERSPAAEVLVVVVAFSPRCR